jgi:hypothetical protein
MLTGEAYQLEPTAKDAIEWKSMGMRESVPRSTSEGSWVSSQRPSKRARMLTGRASEP